MDIQVDRQTQKKKHASPENELIDAEEIQKTCSKDMNNLPTIGFSGDIR